MFVISVTHQKRPMFTIELATASLEVAVSHLVDIRRHYPRDLEYDSMLSKRKSVSETIVSWDGDV